MVGSSRVEHGRGTGLLCHFLDCADPRYRVSAPASAQQDIAIRILRAHGATDIERPEGTIVGGEWNDFNPLTPLRLVAG